MNTNFMIEANFPLFPSDKIGTLYHVGTMDITKKRRDSYEGDGLSVSICPETWIHITEGRTNGDTFSLSKQNPQLLDYYSLTDDQKSAVTEWGKEQGYVQDATLYKAFFYDENGEECFMLFSTYEEALEETEDEEFVKECQSIVATNKLQAITYTEIELLCTFDILLERFAEDVLQLDGIYWDEELDVSSYSAPRGVIFNSKLSTFDISLCNEYGICDDYEEER